MRSSFDPQRLSDFARYYGFHYDSLDPAALAREILIDMERGLEGLGSSLPMIPSYIVPVSKVQTGKTVLALDAGGTNLRVSRVRFDAEGRAVAEGTRKHPMPGTNGRVDAGRFFDTIADAAIPVIGDPSGIDGIGFTFSYHIDIQPNADGILLSFSKEIDAPEVIGKAIGAGLREALARRGCVYDGPIVLLNDTAATLLSGLAAIPASGVDGSASSGAEGGPVIGFILGTGFNTAYPETSIPKIGFESREAPQIVVCETGTFSLRYRGPLDIGFDSATKNPGTYTLEKATSGAYLGPLTLHVLKQAVRDGVVRFEKSDEFLELPKLDSKTLNEFCSDPFGSGGPLSPMFGPGETDAVASVQYLSSIVAERGAVFAASVLAATVKRMQNRDSGLCRPYAPVRIAVEGTTYMAYKGMRRSVEAWLHVMLAKDKLRPYVIVPVDQASLFGAAVAATSRL